jgi:hypothetical protein
MGNISGLLKTNLRRLKHVFSNGNLINGTVKDRMEGPLQIKTPKQKELRTMFKMKKLKMTYS